MGLLFNVLWGIVITMLNQVQVLLNQCFFLLLSGNNKHPQETVVSTDECWQYALL